MSGGLPEYVQCPQNRPKGDDNPHRDRLFTSGGYKGTATGLTSFVGSSPLI